MHDLQDLWQLAQHSEKDFLNKCVFSLDLNEAREGENLRSVGREFQTTGAWQLKDLPSHTTTVMWTHGDSI